MGGDGIAERIAEREITAERPVLWSEFDFDTLADKMVVQCVSVVTAEPDGNAQAQLIGRPQVDDRCADRKGNRLGVEHYGVNFRRELMEWMPPPDGIAMCQSDVSNNVT